MVYRTRQRQKRRMARAGRRAGGLTTAGVVSLAMRTSTYTWGCCAEVESGHAGAQTFVFLPFFIEHLGARRFRIRSMIPTGYNKSITTVYFSGNVALQTFCTHTYLWIGQHSALVSPLKAYIGRRWQPTSLHACAPLGATAVSPSLLLNRRHAG